MSENKALQKAAQEARKAAERARDFANLFEEYAICLVSPEQQSRARQLCVMGKDKLSEIREAVADSEDWTRVDEWHREAQMFDAEEQASPS